MLPSHMENRHQCVGNIGSRVGFSARETFPFFFAKRHRNGKSNWLCFIRPYWKQTSVEGFFFLLVGGGVVLTRLCVATVQKKPRQRPWAGLLESNCSKIFTQLTPLASWRFVFLLTAVSCPHPCTLGFHLCCCASIHWENSQQKASDITKLHFHIAATDEKNSISHNMDIWAYN